MPVSILLVFGTGLLIIAKCIRCHSSDVYLGMSPIQKGGFYLMY